MSYTFKEKNWIILVFLVVLLILNLGFVQHLSAAHEITWWSVDGGGQLVSQGGEYKFSGTIGQPDSGMLTGGDYTLGGGFWRGGEQVKFGMFLPLMFR